MVDSERELEGFGALDYIQNKNLIHLMDSRKNLYIFIFLSF